MLGAFLTAIFCLGAAGLGLYVFARLLKDLDPALAFGVGGLLGLGLLGTISFPILLLPGGANWGLYLIGALGLAGLPMLWLKRPPLSVPKGVNLLFLLGACIVAACAKVAALTPSDSFDWDTIAYHLAVPKLWIEHGRMDYISFIHQSNFPAVVDDLYVWGLGWGGESGAKYFPLLFGFFGATAMFGFARQKYSQAAGWWSMLAFVGIPLVGWECGTAYIDVSNGLFVALGILFGAELILTPEKKENAWLTAIFLGLAAASKYTGLQTVFVVGLVSVCFLALAKPRHTSSFKLPVLACIVAVAISAPWYIKNVVNTGNPVFPFFYSVFKGKNWDKFSDDIYKNQQQQFGAGREMAKAGQDYADPANPLVPTRIGAAVLGLAYQPGRYADPAPTQGGGFPFVSLGAIPLAGLLLWMLSGRVRRFEGAVIGMVMMSFAMWFVLSEQSRYIAGLAFAACVLVGGAVSMLKAGPVLAGAAVIQLLASVVTLTRYPADDSRFSEKLKVILGGQTTEEYQHRFVGFYDPAQELNSIVKGGKVALYDEVFGYFLDVPYFWANPGHSTEMGYEGMTNSDQLMEAFHRLEITYVYINLPETFGRDRPSIDQWMNAAGIQGTPVPYPDRAERMKDPRNLYKVLLAEAVASGKLTLEKSFGSRLIFTVAH